MKIDKDKWELTKMAVTEAYQAQGIGKKLAKHLIFHFLKTKKGLLFLETIAA